MVQDPHDHDTCLHDPGDHPVPVGEPASLSVGDRTLDVAAAMCQAMGDAPRLRLLLWLSRREMCVTELVTCEQARLGSISARLQRLHAARLVSRRREAKHVYYALADNHVRELLLNVIGHAAESE